VNPSVRVRANRNESPLAPPSHVMRALRSLEPEDLQRYPTEQLERLENALAARLGRGRSSIVVGSGADDLLFALARAYLGTGDNVVTVRPTFGMYATVTESAGARVRAVPYARRWTLDPVALAQAADRHTKLVILGHPNNPTGEPLALDTVARLSRALPDALIVVDEVYLALSPASLVSAVANFPNVAVVGSFSKCAALAGIRVGYATAAEPVAAALRRAMAPYPVGVASLVAAVAYLTGGAETERFERRLAEQVARSLDAIVAAIGPFADGCWRGAGNFVLFDFGDRADAVVGSLARSGVIVRRIEEPEIPGGVRISAVDDAATAVLIGAAGIACGRREVAARA
jgi:histidinol-phosphate aminotransferase